MTHEDIRKTIASFAAGAARAREAGFDAVEILGSAGYLICQFLSPLTNKRTDEYGGDLDHRMRFGCEVIRAVRQVVGPDFPVSIRIAGHDFMDGGHTNREARIFAQAVEDAGVDLINVTGGWHETKVPQTTMDLPRGGFTYLARGIKEVVKVPVIACNRINTPELAEEVLRQGFADLIGLGRPLLADPDFPQKAMSGRSDEIALCLACNQACFDHGLSLQPVGCLVNPQAGFESETKIEPTADPKRVLVIGGGPAGMEAALVLSSRGHQVQLIEQATRLGGQILLAAAPPGREEFLSLATSLTNRLAKTETAVELGRRVTADVVKDIDPEIVVVATGAKPIQPDIPGVDGPGVVQAWDILSGRVTPGELGRRVLVLGGGAVGCETALFLAKYGAMTGEELLFLLENGAETADSMRPFINSGAKQLTIVEMLPKIGRDIGLTNRWIVLQNLERKGVTMRTKCRVTAITPTGVQVDKDGTAEFIPGDSVVLALGSRSENALADEIRALGYVTHVIGDAQAPRKALEAVKDAFDLGRTL
ncbi:MAG: FAD-dependent oxidoreductase, partial [Deltaproteobacteria bacterium]|nr:FAD-dependent oxidoreductase [Deltaproteobacteria bacterium]